jgi:hypothetical protein
MRRLASLICAAAAGVVLAALVAGSAGAHSSGCHSAHSCPSDHHTYVWYDASGQGWDCAEPGAPEYDPSVDRTMITYGGYTYYCRAAGSAPPPTPTPTTTTTTTTPTLPTTTTTTTPTTTTPTTENDGDSAGGGCGIERWSVKTMTDTPARRMSLRPRNSTVRALRLLPAPHVGQQTPRMRGAERTVYRVRARLVEMKLEDDSDVHLVIADPANRQRTMIVEFPVPFCTKAASRAARRKMSVARRALIAACGTPSASSFHPLSGTATITGVGFFDVRHGQTGIAPNGIELHPVLGFGASSC